ncbi:MAG: carboxypeptidase-like regulatory domain-containing protein [Actinomycetota bacterium]|nr:carboxypeptidase-like regulatory domain-containing protein [Actinomycetota bacterium]
MRLEVDPRSASVVPGRPTVLTVRVVNTGTVISGCRIRVLGVDPRWVQLDQDQLSLFPDTAGIAVLTVTFPPGIPAGIRRVGVEVQELTPPAQSQVVEVELSVPAELGLKVNLDPVSTTSGKMATVGVLIDNTGNGPVEVELTGSDEEGQVRFRFVPVTTVLAAGERTLATAELRAKRPFMGSPKIRPFKVLVGPGQPPVGAFGSWVQRPVLSRGAIALIALLLVASVFAAILTISLSKVVSKSTADRNLALQVAQAGSAGAGAGSGSIAGTVTLLTSDAKVPGVTVEIFQASNVAAPLASTATKPDGTYTFGGLGVGAFKIRFRGAGFSELWFPASLTPDNGTPVELKAGQAVTGIDARLGGVPASLAGLVVGADPTGAVVSLQLPGPVPGAAGPSGSQVATGSTAPATAGSSPAIVTTQTLDAGGAFALSQIPSPSTYQLVVVKQGYATATQQVVLGSGEQRKGITITLRKGDGSISGSVSDASGPIGGAAITASDGHTSVSTVSLNQGNVGSFLLTNLPTPSTFTVTVSNPGSATQTLTLTLSPAQQLTGVSVTLTKGVGSVSGMATLAGGTSPAAGVTVTVTNGKLTLQTVTLSVAAPAAAGGGGPGSYSVGGLPVPGTYTVTFARADLGSQTKAVNLTSAIPDQPGVNVMMSPSTGILKGTVYETILPGSTGACAPVNGKRPVGEVAVNVSSGANAYQMVSATAPSCGQYEFDNVQPGTYTLSFTRAGGLPASSIVTVGAGATVTFNPTLAPAASITGIVKNANGGPQLGAEVHLQVCAPAPAPPCQPDNPPGGKFLSTNTDANGQFVFMNLDAPQTYLIEFRFPAGAPHDQQTREITVGPSVQYQLCTPTPTKPNIPPGTGDVCPITVTQTVGAG